MLNLKKETVTGKLSVSKKIFYFVYEVPVNGKVTMKISSELADDMDIQIYDSEKRQIASTKCEKQTTKKSSTTTFYDYYEKGTYYMKLSPVISGDSGKFSIVSTVDKVKSADKERNNDLTAATEIELGKTVTGLLTLTDTEDFYKVHIPSGEKGVFITVSSSISEEIGVYVKSADGLSDESGKALYKKNGITAPYVYVKPSNGGVYYIRVFSKSNLDNGTYTIKTKTGVFINEMTVQKENITVKKGKTAVIKMDISPKYHDEDLIYTSDKPTVVKVDSKGKVTGLKKGTAVITITSLSGKVATCKVKVK